MDNNVLNLLCLSMCVYEYVRLMVYVCICVYMNMLYVCLSVYVFVSACVYVFVSLCVYVFVCVFVCM